MATNIVHHNHIPQRFTAAQLAACGLSALDGLPVEHDGGVSSDNFLNFFQKASSAVADFFTAENDVTKSQYH
jgi:hypothetical protein